MAVFLTAWLRRKEMINDQPLGLPKGSVRALVAIIIMVTLCVVVVHQIVTASPLAEMALVALSTIGGSVTTFYFTSRNNNPPIVI